MQILGVPRTTVVLIASVLLMTPCISQAQEPEASTSEKVASRWGSLRGQEDDLPDRFLLRGGYAYAFGTDIRFAYNGPEIGLGPSIDFNRTLGGETSGDAIRVDGRFRFNPRHSLTGTWYRLSFDGTKNIDAEVETDELIFQAGAELNTTLSLSLYRLMYNYSFFHNEKVELAFSPGLYLANIKLRLNGSAAVQADNQTASATAAGESSDLTLPLPSIGGYVVYNITPRLSSEIRADWFWLQVGGFTGSMLEFYAGLDYRLFKHLGLGAAYDRVIVDVSLEDQDDGVGTVDVGWNLVYFYGSLHF